MKRKLIRDPKEAYFNVLMNTEVQYTDDIPYSKYYSAELEPVVSRTNMFNADSKSIFNKNDLVEVRISEIYNKLKDTGKFALSNGSIYVYRKNIWNSLGGDRRLLHTYICDVEKEYQVTPKDIDKIFDKFDIEFDLYELPRFEKEDLICFSNGVYNHKMTHFMIFLP